MVLGPRFLTMMATSIYRDSCIVLFRELQKHRRLEFKAVKISRELNMFKFKNNEVDLH